jgi:tetratricopeptide (TPR) repeat protein
MAARHRTLRAAIAWSYELLSQAEQTLFARLGVFVGGCSLSAVESVCNSEGDLGVSVLEGVEGLLNKSMLKQQRDEGIRGERPFTMLETIREYALERLIESGEIDRTRHLHAEYYLALVEAAESELRGPDQLSWLNRLSLELDNIRAALEWSREARSITGSDAGRKTEIGLRIACAMYRFWLVRGPWSEGRYWLENTLQHTGRISANLRARATLRLAYVSWHMADFKAAEKLSQEALVMYRDLGDKEGIADALLAQAYPIGNVLLRAQIEESLALYQELGDKAGISRALYTVAQLDYEEGRYTEARLCSEQCLEMDRQIGDRWGTAYPMGMLATLLLLECNYASARALFEECLLLQQELGDKRLIARGLCWLGQVEQKEGNYSRAESLYLDSLLRFKEIGAKRQVAECVARLAEVACAQEHPERAAILFGASETLRHAIQHTLESNEQADYDYGMKATRAQLADEVFAAAWARGHIMDLQQIVAYASRIS